MVYASIQASLAFIPDYPSHINLKHSVRHKSRHNLLANEVGSTPHVTGKLCGTVVASSAELCGCGGQLRVRSQPLARSKNSALARCCRTVTGDARRWLLVVELR